MLFDFHTLFNHIPEFLPSIFVSIRIAIISIILGCFFGLIINLIKINGDPFLNTILKIFVNIFRTIPEMVLIFWIYSCLPLILSIRISSEVCGIIALTLISTAYLSEILRAGIESISKGEIEAGYSLGLSIFPIWYKIILPTAVRRMIPPFINFFTEILKATSLLSAISVGEMAYKASILGAKTLAYFEFLSLIAVIYFIIIYPVSFISNKIEDHYSKLLNL